MSVAKRMIEDELNAYDEAYDDEEGEAEEIPPDPEDWAEEDEIERRIEEDEIDRQTEEFYERSE